LYFNKRRFVRQVTRTEKDTSDWKTGKLNGERPLTTQMKELVLPPLRIAKALSSIVSGLATIKT
jgi:hypothetical protein